MCETGKRPASSRALIAGLIIAAAFWGRPHAIRAQEGSGAARLGGTLIGLYSGSVLGLTGSALPCAQNAATRTCARVALASGGVIAGIAGGVLGDADSEAVEDALRAAGFGALAGAAVGVAVKELVYYYDWPDVLAFTALGAAIGPVAPGAALGLVAGGILGFGLYLIVPSFEFADAAALGVAGLAVGGLVAWTLKAADARSDPARVPSVTIDLLTLRF